MALETDKIYKTVGTGQDSQTSGTRVITQSGADTSSAINGSVEIRWVHSAYPTRNSKARLIEDITLLVNKLASDFAPINSSGLTVP